MPKFRETAVPVRKPSESLLRNSQSPSFADFKLEEEPVQRINRKREGLTIRDNKTSSQSISPITKRCKPENEELQVKLLEHGFTADYFWEIRENAKRIQKITCADIDIFEIYQTMRSSASAIPCPKTIVPDESPPRSQGTKSSVDDRKNTITKLFSRRHALKMSSETLHLAVALFDICCNKMLIDSGSLDDLAAVSLVVASKVEEIDCLTLQNVISLKMVGQGKTLEMISRLERMVLSSLSFRATVPTPFTFATYILVQIDALPPKISLTSYLVELSLLYVFNRHHPSDSIAHAATCLAFAIDHDGDSSAAKTLLDMEVRLSPFCRIDVPSLKTREIMRTLADLFVLAPLENHVMYREYCTPRRYSVATRQFSPSLQKALHLDASP